MRSVLKRALGAVLREYRVKRKIAQESMGPSQSYISNLEAGRWSPSLDKIEQMAAVLDVHPATIIIAGYIRAEEQARTEELIERIRCELKQIEL
ncbi:TPA: helix-turn-helix domain-containing protein [Pseudomonas aeruginosa]|uniref:helix-turn-helix domain-containing protein n=1 Tax=Pseudomonas aeruginosa TaxID=287 RepID=UPI00301C2DF5